MLPRPCGLLRTPPNISPSTTPPLQLLLRPPSSSPSTRSGGSRSATRGPRQRLRLQARAHKVHEYKRLIDRLLANVHKVSGQRSTDFATGLSVIHGSRLQTGPEHRLLTCRAGHRAARRRIPQGRTSKPLRCVAEECCAPVFRTCIRAAHLALGVRSGPPVSLQDGWSRVCGRGPPPCLKTSPSSVNSVRRQVATHGCTLCEAAAPGCAYPCPF